MRILGWFALALAPSQCNGAVCQCEGTFNWCPFVNAIKSVAYINTIITSVVQSRAGNVEHRDALLTAGFLKPKPLQSWVPTSDARQPNPTYGLNVSTYIYEYFYLPN